MFCRSDRRLRRATAGPHRHCGCRCTAAAAAGGPALRAAALPHAAAALPQPHSVTVVGDSSATRRHVSACGTPCAAAAALPLHSGCHSLPVPASLRGCAAALPPHCLRRVRTESALTPQCRRCRVTPCAAAPHCRVCRRCRRTAAHWSRDSTSMSSHCRLCRVVCRQCRHCRAAD